MYSQLGDKGMFSAPTGTHDEIRMSTSKNPDLVKTIFAFMLTIKHVPFIYYGDEIGIEHNFALSKDGGGVRTGARTPMQWTEEKGKGFSSKKRTYLPVSNKKGQSVEAQSEEENSTTTEETVDGASDTTGETEDETTEDAVSAKEYPFAPFLCTGFWIALMFGARIITAYLSLFGL